METATILIVDDDENTRQLYSDALTMAGLSVTTAASGEEGIEMALKVHPRLILMDIMLPGMQGQEVVEQIRLDPWGKHAHVIYLTNLSDAENVVTAVASHPDDYIIKASTEIKDVVNRVRQAMTTND